MKNRILTLILAATMLATISCGSSSGSTETTTSADTTAAEETGYPYPAEGLGGYSFRVLNYDDFFGCKITLDFESATGEVLDDAIYNRNRQVEEKLGITFEEIQMTYPGWSQMSDIIDRVMKSAMTDDDDFDAALLPITFKPAAITDGTLADLNELGTVDFESEWWDPSINESLVFDGKRYVASSSFNLLTFDLAWVLLFNENMMTDNSLEYPYELVKSGEWTVDKFGEYVKGAAKLNGADDYAWKDGSPVVYGIAGHLDVPIGFINASGITYMKKDGSDYKLELTNEKFVTLTEKLSSILNDKNGNVWWGNGDVNTAGSYLNLFNTDKALFLTCELKASSDFRNMKSSYGLLPLPKYDESQSEYISPISNCAGFLAVPVSQDDMNRTGLILDALSYESHKMVLPTYYETHLSQKALRNEDSIEMLKIIRSTLMADLGNLLGITSTYANNIAYAIRQGGETVASLAASSESAASSALANMLDALN